MRILTNLFLASFAMTLVVIIASCASSVQEGTAAAPVEEERQQIVITGSRIARSDTLSEAPAIQAEVMQRNRERRVERALESLAPEARAKASPIPLTSWKPSKQAANNAVIKVGDKEEISPQALDVKVQVDGFRARVVIDGFYFNSHSRDLEGAFKFRLPDGAVPYFFAFGETTTFQDSELKKPLTILSARESNSRLLPTSLMRERETLWKEPKEAIMVAKEKAAFAYHDTVANQIDPALLEWSGAGVFSAKVFPLLANKLHRVVIGYDVDLKRVENSLLLDLPVSESVIQKRIHLAVNQSESTKVRFHRVIEDDVRAATEINKVNGVLQTTIQGSLINGIRLVVGSEQENTLVGESEGQEYFARRWVNSLPNVKTNSSEKAVFVLDTSLSASPDKFHLWVELVSKILSNNQDDLKEFALLTFNTGSYWWKSKYVANTKNNRLELQRYLNHLILEGATDLQQSFNFLARSPWLTSEGSDLNFDLFLMSDGSITWGEKDPYFLSTSLSNNFSGRLFAYRLGLPGENSDLLTHLTREIGGVTYRLASSAQIELLSKAHKTLPWKIESLTLGGTEDVLINGRPNSTYPGEQLIFSGRVSSNIGKSAQLVVSQGTRRQRIDIPMNQTITSKLTPRVYGQIAVSQLESIGSLERKVASAYANHFRVPGQSSSLLMLESKRDYERYNIRPQEDVFIVNKITVEHVFGRLLDNFASALSDPKRRFLNQLDKLQSLEFIDLDLPDSISILLESLSSAAFEVPIENTVAKKLDKKNIPAEYLENITTGQSHYDNVEKEAKRRLNVFGQEDALKVMSSLVELAPSDVAILRDVAFAAQSYGLASHAFMLHSEVSKLRPYEPHSYTYLAKLANELGRRDLALLYFEIGLASNWRERYGDYSLIHKIDYANFLAEALNGDGKFESRDYALLKYKRLKREIDLEGSDLIVAISWNTDRTDIDLHIVEPSGEECYFSHNKTESGGYITKDVTTGYGPEMYVNQSAPEGRYDLLVNYYRSDQNRLGLKTKVLVRTIRNWGTETEKEEMQTVVLTSDKEKQRIKTISI